MVGFVGLLKLLNPQKDWNSLHLIVENMYIFYCRAWKHVLSVEELVNTVMMRFCRVKCTLNSENWLKVCIVVSFSCWKGRKELQGQSIHQQLAQTSFSLNKRLQNTRREFCVQKTYISFWHLVSNSKQPCFLHQRDDLCDATPWCPITPGNKKNTKKNRAA